MLICTRTNRCTNSLGGFAKPEYPLYCQPISTGLHCANQNCITADPAESQYAANKFYIVEEPHRHDMRLRCVYCESDIDVPAGTTADSWSSPIPCERRSRRGSPR